MYYLRCGLILLLVLPLSTHAAVVITPDTGDSPLVIRGWLDDAGGFTGQLRLTAHHDPPKRTAT